MNHNSEIARCPDGVLLGNQSGWERTVRLSSLSYPSTTIIFAIVAVECFVAVVLILWRWNGVRIASTSPRAPLLLNLNRREVRADTDNTLWAVFTFVGGLTALVNALESGMLNTNDRAAPNKVATLIGRVLFGGSTVALTFALNHHRAHRHQSWSEEDISAIVEKQVRRVNWLTGAVYALYVVCEAVTSAVVPDTGNLVGAFFWLFVVAALLINIPSLFCGLWVAVHRGEVRPSPAARVLLAVGLFFRLVASLPANLWNKHVWYRWYMANPCPVGGVASAFDAIIAFHVPAVVVLTLFVALEHRRNSVYHLRDRVLELSNAIDDVASCGNQSADFSNHSLQR